MFVMFLDPAVNRFGRQTLRTGNISLLISFALSHFAHQKKKKKKKKPNKERTASGGQT
jgi:hypothetical protein